MKAGSATLPCCVSPVLLTEEREILDGEAEGRLCIARPLVKLDLSGVTTHDTMTPRKERSQGTISLEMEPEETLMDTIGLLVESTMC